MSPVAKHNANWHAAEWPVPDSVRAGTTLRHSGFSEGLFDSLNLALHVGDKPEKVRNNRALLVSTLNLPSEPIWLHQVHGNNVITAAPDLGEIAADGCYTDQPGIVCAVLTADCIPLLICNKTGTEIAAIHVGWRGLCSKIITTAIHRFKDSSDNLVAWLGPHISVRNYEIDEEVKNSCSQLIPDKAEDAFIHSRDGHWYADLAKLTEQYLFNLGVTDITNSGKCSFNEKQDFYSYRRDKETGRMASLIWIEP